MIIAVLFLLVLAYGWLTNKDAFRITPDNPTADSEQNQSTTIEKNQRSDRLKTFTGTEFKKLYQQVAYPNTQQIKTMPEITGHTTADNRIRKLAEARGYELRSIPDSPIFKTGEPNLGEDDLLQEKALAAWKKLKQAAAADGISLTLTSGYRSIEWQRIFFMAAINSRGISSQQIAAGSADAALESILKTVAVPGYSRHHTGYTIDMQCGNGAVSFEYTNCFTWLSKDNYENAKLSGWIPSYPEGTGKQGPDPEAWEYVWVGEDVLYEQAV